MDKKKLLTITIYILINSALILTAYLNKTNFDTITYLVVVESILALVTNFIVCKKVLLVENIFLIFTVLFHISHAIIKTFGFDDIYAHRSSIAKTSLTTYINAEIFIMLCIFFINLGYLVFYSNKIKKANEKIEIKDNKDDLSFIRKISFFVLIVSIVPMLYIDIGKIFALINGGYLNTYKLYSEGIGKYFFTISKFSRPAISLIIFSYINDRKKAKKWFIISSIYYFIVMLSGDRGTYLIYIIANFFIYNKYIEKLNVKRTIVYCFLLYFVMTFLSSISLFRYSEFSFESYVNVVSLRSSDGILYSFLREFGASMTSVVYSFDFIPSYNEYNYGFTYIFSLLNILPKIPTALAESLKTSFAFTYAFPLAQQDSLGGSYIGELYYNFGWFGSFISIFIGFLIGKIDSIFEKGNKIYSISIAIVILPCLILWVRDFFCGLLFIPFWYGFIMLFFRRIRKNEGTNNN